MADTAAWTEAVRSSHEHFVELVSPLSERAVEGPSYAKDWSIAQTASHLGSQAEIFGLSLEAGLTGGPAPGGELFGPIWARWDALAPVEQVRESVAANEAFVSRVEGVSVDERDRFALSLFGMDLDLAGLLALRLGEHALHTWDIAVALDASATIPADAVDLLVDRISAVAARSGVAVPQMSPVSVVTTSPARSLQVTLDPAVGVEPVEQAGPDPVVLPAEALIRLVYGRLDPDHTPAGVGDERLDTLRTVFPGF